MQIESTVIAKRAASYGKKSFLFPAVNSAGRHAVMFGNDLEGVQRNDCLSCL